MVFVYVFRHGETDWNSQGRFQGHTDIPLNAKGRKQALELRKLLGALNPEMVLSSDLSRAFETAQIASEGLNLPIIKHAGLREAFLGEPEGRLREEIMKIYGDEMWQKWLSVDAEHMDFSFPKGETKRQQLARSVAAIEETIKQHPGLQRLAVSTHGGTLRRLVHNCEGAPKEPIAIPNCSLYQMEFDKLQPRWVYHGTVSASKSKDKFFG